MTSKKKPKDQRGGRDAVETGPGDHHEEVAESTADVADTQQSGSAAETGTLSGNSDGVGSATDGSESQVDPSEPELEQWDEEVETVYEQTASGHRVTRRVTRRKTSREQTSEEFEEHVTDESSHELPAGTLYPPAAYQAPGSSTHPAPVG